MTVTHGYTIISVYFLGLLFKNSCFFLPYIEIQDSFVNDRGNALVGIIKRFLLLLVLLRHGCPIAVVVSDLVTFLS